MTDPAAPIMINVRGEANLEADPELCEFAVTVEARDKDRRATLEKLTQRNNQLLDQIKSGYAEALEKLESGRLYVYPEQKGRDEKIRSYLGSARIRVVVKDFTALGEMITRLADAEMRSIDGPYWSLRRDSEVYRRARTEAVAEAVTRAKEYAAAIGSQITALVELSDSGLSTQGAPAPQGMVRYAALAKGSGSGGAYEPPALDLEPVRQSVYASVEARFTGTQPGSL